MGQIRRQRNILLDGGLMLAEMTISIVVVQGTRCLKRHCANFLPILTMPTIALRRHTLVSYAFNRFIEQDMTAQFIIQPTILLIVTATEDVQIARCLRYLGISFTDTRDVKGRERFHPFAPGTHLHWQHDPSDWYEQYNKEWGILTGKDCCAPDSVSFHYVKKASMVRHMQALIYSCDDEQGK
jgi:hypothetical protein